MLSGYDQITSDHPPKGITLQAVMKILTWNINGIRATNLPLKELLDSLDADVICFQETKVTRDQLEERCAVVEGYNSYFSFSNVKSGYSGVATFVRDGATPLKAEEGLSGLRASGDEHQLIGNYGDQSNFTEEELCALDNEGRAILTQHQFMGVDGQMLPLTVINVYCPRADPEREDRKSFKLRFYELLQIRAEAILESSSHVIVLGDINTAHRPIDRCDAVDHEEFKKHPGRQWLGRFLSSHTPHSSSELSSDKHTSSSQEENETCNDQSLNIITTYPAMAKDCDSKTGKFLDTFRYFHPDEQNAFTCWNTSTGSRQFNYGSRIDYVFTDCKLCESYGLDCTIHPDIQGSDHCPVKLRLTADWWPVNHKCPRLCTKYMPEFAGRQQKLSAFLVKGVKSMSDSRLSQASSSLSQAGHTVTSTSQQPLKRISSSPSKNIPKRPKLDLKASGVRQKTLASFFKKKLPEPKSTMLKLKSMSQTTLSVEPEKSEEIPEDIEKIIQAKSHVTNQWKNLLKGPTPAPLCKGHKEPCVLRTVKKDSLNKGRQFYTCARGEGPKSNLESRCEHFEWVEKKKKSLV